MGERIHTGRSSERFGHGTHQLCIDDCQDWNIIRVYTDHFLDILFVGNHIVDSYFCCCSCRSWQSYNRNGFVFGIGYTFQ